MEVIEGISGKDVDSEESQEEEEEDASDSQDDAPPIKRPRLDKRANLQNCEQPTRDPLTRHPEAKTGDTDTLPDLQPDARGSRESSEYTAMRESVLRWRRAADRSRQTVKRVSNLLIIHSTLQLIPLKLASL